MQDFIPPRPILPHESLENAVYCAECKHLGQEILGANNGTCFGFPVDDAQVPLVCNYYKGDSRLVSVMVFLKSGISVYHKAIVKDVGKQLDPELLTSFLQAINMFGEELTQEEVSLIQFQKLNIIFCRGKYANGALLIRGKIHDDAREIFSYFINTLESAYPDYFKGGSVGICLPEDEVDRIALKAMRKFARDNFYPINPEIIESQCSLMCGSACKH